MVHEVGGALDPGIGQLANLLTVEAIPPPPTELLIEVNDEFGMDKVDKSIADIARVVLVDRQVEEVNLHFVVASNLLVKHLLGVLVGYMADHEGSSAIWLNLDKSGGYLVSNDFVLVDLLSRYVSLLALRLLAGI